MRNFWFGVVCGLAFAILLSAAGLWLVPWWMARAPRVAAGSTLVLTLGGTIAEREPVDLSLLGAEPPWTTLRLWETLRKAAADPRIAAVLLMPEKPGAGWAKLAEIRGALLAFRKTGKPVVAFLRGPNSRDFYLATAANRIAISPGDWVDVKGLRAELLYARGTLDKLGILPEFEAIGRYKDGADILTRPAPTAETREVINSMLDHRLQELIGAISAGRKKTPERVREILDHGPFIASEALSSGLVDATEFEDQTRAELARQLKQAELKTIAAADYQRVRASAVGLGGKQKIAFLVAEGDILRAPIPMVAADVLDPASFVKTIRRVRDDTKMRAAILRIDSPGGDAIASDEMLRELRLLAVKKPLIVSMSDVAASGGYALALSGHLLVAYPQTVTGSIGVFFGKLTLSGLYEKLGLHKEVFTRGRFADIDSDARPLTPEARQKLRDSLQKVYSGFVGQVAAARKRKYEEIDPIAQGRVWLGSEAKDRGLVDELGGIDRAVELAKQRAGIALQEPVNIEAFPEKPGLRGAIQGRISL
ncbi:MAG TPA: signal peptide peptidase SppA, partial [Bryobacteraceae bacterium]|nr:signal peptide peptidase SppA [Bryobacteraceae bacterium]